jgi:hypothetical protein
VAPLSTGEPIVVTIRPSAPEPWSASLADVFVVLADHGHASDRGAEFFRRYPGLTLVLTVDEMGEASALFRDGVVLVVVACHLTQSHASLQEDRVTPAAELLYICWATGLLHDLGLALMFT